MLFANLFVISVAFLFSHVSPYLDEKIIGGNAINIGLIPYQVSVQYNEHHNCGGAIIGYNVVLTAAHCVDGAKAWRLSVFAGKSKLYTDGVRVQVKSIIVHKDYIRSTSENDIAILKLSTSLPFNGKILPVALPSLNEEIAPGTKSVVSGWGHTKENGTVTTQLQAAIIPIIRRDVCRKLYYMEKVTDSMLCAAVSGGGKDACQGDSGGPLVANGKLHGIVSWGRGCARAEYPGVYTQVSKYRNWIKIKCRI